MSPASTFSIIVFELLERKDQFCSEQNESELKTEINTLIKVPRRILQRQPWQWLRTSNPASYPSYKNYD